DGGLLRPQQGAHRTALDRRLQRLGADLERVRALGLRRVPRSATAAGGTAARKMDPRPTEPSPTEARPTEAKPMPAATPRSRRCRTVRWGPAATHNVRDLTDTSGRLRLRYPGKREGAIHRVGPRVSTRSGTIVQFCSEMLSRASVPTTRISVFPGTISKLML